MQSKSHRHIHNVCFDWMYYIIEESIRLDSRLIWNSNYTINQVLMYGHNSNIYSDSLARKTSLYCQSYTVVSSMSYHYFLQKCHLSFPSLKTSNIFWQNVHYSPQETTHPLMQRKKKLVLVYFIILVQNSTQKMCRIKYRSFRCMLIRLRCFENYMC